MILYDGVDIRSVADVKIEDIRVSAIQWLQTARNRAISPGSVFVRNRAGTRTVTVTFALLQMNRNARQAALTAINAWAKSDKEYRIDVPGHPDHYLMGVCTAKPDPSLRQWWESKLRLVFTCYNNPFWTDNVEKSANCGTAFTVLGDAEPLMRIERTVTGSAVSDQSYALDGRTITLSTIPVGNMTLDLNNQLIQSVNGSTITDLMQYYGITSRFLIPRTGAQTITGTGTIKYRERWE